MLKTQHFQFFEVPTFNSCWSDQMKAYLKDGVERYKQEYMMGWVERHLEEILDSWGDYYKWGRVIHVIADSFSNPNWISEMEVELSRLVDAKK